MQLRQPRFYSVPFAVHQIACWQRIFNLGWACAALTQASPAALGVSATHSSSASEANLRSPLTHTTLLPSQ